MPDTINKTVDTSSRELSAERILNAPRQLVWQVWTEPNHTAKWWGPNGFTNTIESMDVRAGGQWKFIMHGPDGTDYRNLITYIEIKEPELIVYEHTPSPKFTVTVNFEEIEGKTKITMKSLFETAEVLENIIKTFKADEGMKQNLIKLMDYLREITS